MALRPHLKVTMVRCGFSRFVTDSCGQSIASNECVALQCTRDITGLISKVSTLSMLRLLRSKSEIQLLLAREGTDSNYLSISL